MKQPPPIHIHEDMLVLAVDRSMRCLQVYRGVEVGQGRHYHGSRASATKPVHGRAFPVRSVFIVPAGTIPVFFCS